MEYGSVTYQIIKAIHIIFMVSYFAGIFYIVRLFIYHTEANNFEIQKKNILFEQFSIMEKRLWNIIIAPAFTLMLISGLTLLISQKTFLISQSWMHFKLLFISFLFVYHFITYKILGQIQKNIFKYTSKQLRMLNEVPTLILFAVVFAVILKSAFAQYWYWFVITFIFTGVLLMTVVKITNKK